MTASRYYPGICPDDSRKPHKSLFWRVDALEEIQPRNLPNTRPELTAALSWDCMVGVFSSWTDTTTETTARKQLYPLRNHMCQTAAATLSHSATSNKPVIYPACNTSTSESLRNDILQVLKFSQILFFWDVKPWRMANGYRLLTI